MKTLIIDHGRYDTCLYVEDTEVLVVRKSRNFNYNATEVVQHSIDILKRNPDIKTVKIDQMGLGRAIIDGLKYELYYHKSLKDIQILEYKLMAL